MSVVNDWYAFAKQGKFPSDRGLKREPTEVDLSLIGVKSIVGTGGWGSQSSTETLKAKATAGRVKWLQSESTIKVRPGQKAAFDGLMDIWRKGVKMVCGISFKLTVV